MVFEQGEYWIEDLNSRHGTYVNGAKIQRHKLQDSDRIEFGTIDSYQLIFMPAGGQVTRLLDHFPAPEKSGGKLGKLKAVMEVARALQTSLSSQDVLIGRSGCGAGRHRRRARIPAAAQGRRAGDESGAGPLGGSWPKAIYRCRGG